MANHDLFNKTLHLKSKPPRSWFSLIWVAVLSLSAGATSLQALIVGSPGEPDDGIDHSAVHPSRAPMQVLDHVGQLGDRGSGSAVYLGKKWIITAYHAFQGRASDDVTFSGETYQMQPNKAVRLKNPKLAGEGVPQFSDLLMVPLQTAPDLPSLDVSVTIPFSGELVVLVGYGETEPEANLAESTAEPAADLFRSISDETLAAEAAAETGSRTLPRWGENVIAERSLRIGIPGKQGATSAFATIRQPNGTTDNAQGAAGDSGGGVFVKRGEDWQLAGIMLSILRREEMGASATFIADLSAYHQQIAATIPEPSTGAFLLVASLLACARRRR